MVTSHEYENNILNDVVFSHDCAILIAAPLDKNAFFSDLKIGFSKNPCMARGHFAVIQCCAENKVQLEKGWDSYEKHVIPFIKNLIIDSNRIGAKIDAEATISGIMRAFQQAKVVIILAHWRGFEWSDNDFALGAWTGICQRLKNPQGDLAKTLANLLQERFGLTSDAPRARMLAKAFDDFTTKSDLGSPEDIRDSLDKMFSDFVIRGNVLELRDGYHSAEEVAHVVPAEWSGIIELGVCCSLRLALALKQDRKDRRVITNENIKMFGRILSEINETLLRLADVPQPYVQLRQKVHSSFSQFANEVAKLC